MPAVRLLPGGRAYGNPGRRDSLPEGVNREGVVGHGIMVRGRARHDGRTAMGTTREQIRGWLERGVADGATHMVVACDTFDWEDYPVYVSPGESVAEVAEAHHGEGMQKVMEVYDLGMDLDAQLAEARAWHGWRPGQGAT